MRTTVEDAVIKEARAFVDNVNKLNELVTSANDEQITPLVDKLRHIEKRSALLYTFFVASSYGNSKRDDEDKSSTNRPPLSTS